MVVESLMTRIHIASFFEYRNQAQDNLIFIMSWNSQVLGKHKISESLNISRDLPKLRMATCLT